MATVKKSKKKKIIIAVSIILVIAIIAGSIVAVASGNKKETVSLTTIGTSDIYESVSATGEISSGSTKEYSVGTVAVVKEVFVKVGDEVKEGDKLATFDTSTLDGEVKKLQSTYNQAKTSYNESVKTQKTAKANLAEVEDEIAQLEKELGVAKYNLENPTTTTTKARTTAAPTTKPSTEPSSKPEVSKPTTTTTTRETVTYPNTIGGVVEALTDLVETINSLADDVKTTNEITRVVMEAIAEKIESGEFSSDAIAQAAGDAMAEAIRKGLIEETELIIESGVAVDMIEAAVRAVDWNAIGTSIANSPNVDVSATELRLAALYAQQQIFSLQASNDTVYAKKEIMDSSKSALDAVKEADEELSAGWTAAFDGTITACDIHPDEQTSVLSGGITLQNMDNKIVTVSLNEYDIHKVKVGMSATITTAYGNYTGQVITKAPTATGGSQGSILDSVGSMAGISGLSSLTESGAGVEVQVSVNNPDENIIIGFDADVEISVGDHLGVTTVPIESIILEKTGAYVYLYNEEEETVTKTLIETGAISDSSYEVTSGLKQGDRIVSAPQSTYEEETFSVKVADKSTEKVK